MAYGSLIIKFAADLAEFQKDLGRATTSVEREFKKMQRSAQTFGRLFQAALIVGGASKAISSFKELANAADEVGKASQRIGIGAEALQTLTFAASQSGLEFDELEKGLRKLTISLGDFERGTGEAQDAFKALGFQAEDFKGKGLDQNLLLLADRFAVMADSAGKAEIAAKIFGEKIGTRLIPFLNEGAEGIKKLQEEAKRLGGVFSDELVEASTRFNDNVDKLMRAITELKIQALGPLIKDLADITDVFTRASTAALTFGEKLKLIFSGNVNQGRFFELTQELEGLKKQLEDVPNRSKVAKFFTSDEAARQVIQARIDDANKERDSLNKLITARGQLAEETAKPPPRTAVAPKIVDTKKTSDLAAQIARAQLALEEARGKALIDSEERLADVRLELLDRFHAKGLIGEEDYWARRLQVQEAALQASIQAIEREIAARQAAQAKLKVGSPEFLTAEKEIFDAQTRLNKLVEEFGIVTLKSTLDGADALDAYKDEVKKVSAELLTLQGRTSEALAITLDLEQAGLRRRAAQFNDPATAALADQLKSAKIAQEAFNAARERGQEIQSRLAIEEERIQNSLRVGAISELESLKKTEDERKKAIGQLSAISDELKALGESSGLAKLKLQAEEFAVSIETLGTQVNLLSDKFQQIGEGAFSTFLEDVVSGTKSLKQAFTDMANSIVKDIGRIAAQNIAQAVLGGTGGSNAFGDIFAKIFSGVGGFFSGGGSSFPVGEIAGMFMAGGGSVTAGRPYIVGERGPELFMPNTSGAIIPNGAMGGGGGNVINITVAGSTDQRTASQIGAEVSRALARAGRRNG